MVPFPLASTRPIKHMKYIPSIGAGAPKNDGVGNNGIVGDPPTGKLFFQTQCTYKQPA